MRLGNFRVNEWLGVEWVANRQEMDVEPDSKPQRTVIDLSYYFRPTARNESLKNA